MNGYHSSISVSAGQHDNQTEQSPLVEKSGYGAVITIKNTTTIDDDGAKQNGGSFGGVKSKLALVMVVVLVLVVVAAVVLSRFAASEGVPSLSIFNRVSYGSCYSKEASFFCISKCDGGAYVNDCSACEGYMTGDRDHRICIDRRLFEPTNTDPTDYHDHYHFFWNDLVGAIVWFFTAGIAIACGVGGGGIYVPLGIVLFKFGPKQSSGFSQACIFGASLAGFILNSTSNHPVHNIRHDAGIPESERPLHKQMPLTQAELDNYVANNGIFYTRPLINYDMALFLSPMQTAGAVLGVLVQKMLPNWLYLLISGMVLSYTAYRTFKKYFAARKAEIEKQQAQVAEQEKLVKQTLTLSKDSALDSIDSSNHRDKYQNRGDQDDEKFQLRKRYLEDDMRQYPKEKLGALFILWIGLFILTILQGGEGVESLLGIHCDSPWYYFIILLQFLWLFLLAAYFGHKLFRDQEARVAVDYPYLGEEDPVWDAQSTLFYGAFCFVSGIVSAIIGIGGGMVLGPMMLIMGVDPRVSSSTNSTMIVVTSSSIAIMFVTSGLVPLSYALFYFCVNFCGAWLGKSKIDSYVKRKGRASMLIFILGCIIAFATVGCFIILFTRLVEKNWCFDGFQPFCKIGHVEQCPVNQMLGIGTATPAPLT